MSTTGQNQRRSKPNIEGEHIETEKGIVFVPIETAVINTTGLTAQDLLVYAAYKQHRNQKTKQCNPSIMTVAKETSMSESAVKRRRRNLKEKGLLVWKQESQNKSCDYVFPLLDGSPETRESTLKGLRGTRDSKKWEKQTVYQRGSGVTPQSSTGGGEGSSVTPLKDHQWTPRGGQEWPSNYINITKENNKTPGARPSPQEGGGSPAQMPDEVKKKLGLIKDMPEKMSLKDQENRKSELLKQLQHINESKDL